ncbi:MAG: hypothetical protein IJ180_01905 [Bacteroidales bacterium]|nr:hypothetical protein [Bacteroidales bacterium]
MVKIREKNKVYLEAESLLGSLEQLLEDPNIRAIVREKVEIKEGQKAKKKKYTTEEYDIYKCLVYGREKKDNTQDFKNILSDLTKVGLIKQKYKNNKDDKTVIYWWGTKKSFAMFCFVVAQNLFFRHKTQAYPYFIALIKDKKGNDFNSTMLSQYKGHYSNKSEKDEDLENILIKNINENCLKCLDK